MTRFEQVITTILVVDYSEIKAEFDQKFKELKMERIRLLNERINENTGKKIDLSLFSEYGFKHSMILYNLK